MPSYERGDYVKVEFQDETTVIDEKRLERIKTLFDALRIPKIDVNPVTVRDASQALASF